MDRRARTAVANYETNPKFVYYLSAEFMLGRQLPQNELYTGTLDLARQALANLGVSRDKLDTCDAEPGLGNGGLGRLAACLLESLATLDIPAVGYGIRYEFGLFKQEFEDGWQVERPDDWTFYGNPWEFQAPDDRQVVGFYGHTEPVDDDPSGLRARWVPGETVRGEPSHMLVPGYDTETVNIVRLWHARARRESFDLGVVRRRPLRRGGREPGALGEHQQGALSERQHRVRPGAATQAAVPARLLLAARHHPAVPVPQQRLGRLPGQGRRPAQRHPSGARGRRAAAAARRRARAGLGPGLVDHLAARSPTRATPCCRRHWRPGPSGCSSGCCRGTWRSCTRSISGSSTRCAAATRAMTRASSRMSLIQEDPERRVRMANLAVVGSFAVNGVAELQSRLLAETTLRDFAELWPEKFRNVTNGVTPRRFLRLANPRLSALVTARLGDEGWLTDLDRLGELEALVDDDGFPGRVPRRETKEQGRSGRPHLGGHRGRRRPRFAVRRDGETAARVQAPAAQGAPRRHGLPPHQGESGCPRPAPDRDLRGEGGARLPHREAHHQADQLGGRTS